ncbi:hypothetical protein CCP3SC1AL1_810018 [Gammaproteobacteria bacterium]
MTRNEIEHMWKVASNNPNHDTNWHDPVIEQFAELVAQRTWVGLTKDEVELLSYKAEGNTWKAVELAEAKLKEKNNA